MENLPVPDDPSVSEQAPAGSLGCSLDASGVDARQMWVVTLHFHGTCDESREFFEWIGDEIPDRFVPHGEGTGGMDCASLGPAPEEATYEQ